MILFVLLPITAAWLWLASPVFIAGAERIELIQEVVPTAKVIRVLSHPENKNAASEILMFQKAALGLSIRVLEVHGREDFESAFKSLAESGIGGLVIGADALFSSEINSWQALQSVIQYPRYISSVRSRSLVA